MFLIFIKFCCVVLTAMMVGFLIAPMPKYPSGTSPDEIKYHEVWDNRSSIRGASILALWIISHLIVLGSFLAK